MKKIVLINFLIVFLCCGCTVDYDLKINRDLTVKEEISAMESQEFLSEYINSTPEEVIDMIADANGLSSNEYEKVLKKDKSGVKIKNEYASIKEFSTKSKYYKQYFSDINYENNDGIIELKLNSNIINDRDYPDAFYIEKTVIKIKIPFKVTYSNADKVDSLTNTYIWYIYDDTESKDIDIKFDTNKSSFDFSFIIKYIPMVIIAGILIVFAYIVIKIVINKRIENNKF